MEREIKATPEEALEFLRKYAGHINVGLALRLKASQARLTELSVTGAEKYGPDDLDMLIKRSRQNIAECQAAREEFQRLAPLKETQELRNLGQFIERLLLPPNDN